MADGPTFGVAADQADAVAEQRRTARSRLSPRLGAGGLRDRRSRAARAGDVRPSADDGYKVYIVDEAGISWVALYSLEQQPDGTWKISGCQLLRRPGLNA
ncbi:MAG: DUF4864 domain-containing protein [Deltaproteobacteria bacterium]|nr:DUF4864 domain-containing protein [Deltaproteobacteria bacterium]